MKPPEEKTAFDAWAYEIENYGFRIERILEKPIHEAMRIAFNEGYNEAWRRSFLRGTEPQE